MVCACVRPTRGCASNQLGYPESVIVGSARFDHLSKDAKEAQAFYGQVLGWKVQGFPMGNQTYEMIFAGETMIGGYATPKTDQPSHWISYVSVEDVDGAAKAAAANGGKVVEAPYEIPGVGRTARIADPTGAELCPFTSSSGDPADEYASQGRFFWNELHTTDPAKALAFYNHDYYLQWTRRFRILM